MKKSKMKFRPDKKLSCNMGELVPINVFDVVPGDVVNMDTDCMLRTQPLLAPLMHDVNVHVHHFFVPDRIIWDDFEDFITGGETGTANVVAPTIESPSVGGWAVGTLGDYLGLPTGVPNFTRSALPFRAYQAIYNYWYRDSQLITPATLGTNSGPDVTTSRDLQNACWQRDRYTAARPAPQLGPSVVIPLLGDAPVRSDGTTPNVTGAGVTNSNLQGANGGGVNRVNAAAAFTSTSNLVWGTNTGLEADLSAVSAFDVEDLRQASAYQRFLENMNNFGARYSERIQKAFGVPIQDGRLNEPEFLGGGQSRFQFSEVLQTAEGTDPVGEMKGHGITAQTTNRFKYRVPEHGWIMTLMVVRPKTQYMQNCPKMWSRPTKLDYFNPEFANLGDVPIFNSEVVGNHISPNGVFGYAPSWDEYREMPSTVAGEFRTTLNYWHMARDLPTNAALNATFVRANPTTRVFADQVSDQLYITARHNISMRRPIPKYSKPKLM